MRKADYVKKGLLAGLLAISVCMAFPQYSVKANPHYDRRSTVAEEELECVPSAGASEKTEKKISPKAWKKINGVCYNGSGVAIPGAITWGMDVSEWQGKINWTKVKNAGIDFALVRVSYGLNYLDKTYDYNMTQAELAGVPVGTYVFSTATNTEIALKEAQLAISKMDGYKVSYPVVYDLEYSGMQKLSSTEISRLALTFCNEVRKAGYYPMVYCNTYWHDTYVDWSLLSGLDVWIARYGDKIQAPDVERYSYTIWQATDGNTASGLNSTRGLIPGIPAENDVDVDFGYVDYTRKITPRWKADSGYTPSAKPGQDGDSVQEPVKNGWTEEDGALCYYTEGVKATGWQTIEGKTYYFSENGAAAKGMKKIDGKYYWFHAKKGWMYKNRRVTRTNGDIYFFGKDGVRYQDGMYKVKESGVYHTYYFQKNGKAYKGWLTYQGKKYYFYKGSSKLSGTRAENITLTSARKVVSVFDKNGICIRQYKKK